MMKALIVDDTRENVYVLETLLKAHGWEVSSAVNGEDAMERLRRATADLIISDILMPKMDGFQLCREVKADETLKHIPFVFYTATYTMEKDKDFALSLGASRFIIKPTDPGEFIGIIKEVLMEKRTGMLLPGEITIEKDTEYLKEHQARLTKKLEHKISELERAEERYRSIILSANDAIITLDESGMITSWSDAAEKIFGYAVDDIIGKQFSLLIPELLRSEQEAIFTGLKGKQLVGRLEAVGKSKNNGLIPVGVSISLMKDKQSNVLGFSAIIRDMTAQKRAEEAVAESQRLLQDITDNSTALIYALDPQGRFLLINRTLESVFNVLRETVLGKTREAIMPPEIAAAHRSNDLKVMQDRQPSTMEEENIESDGKHTYLSVKFPLIDPKGNLRGVGGISTDITERKQSEEALKKSEKFIQNILSSVGEAFVVIDREYRILSANRAYCEQTGKTLDSIVGRYCYEISHHATQPCHEPGYVCGCKRTFEIGEPSTAIHTHTDDKGAQRQVEIRTFAMKDESGGVQSIIEVINDITEKRALETQLRHSQKMEGIGTLAGGIAHDFNNILSAIIGYGHLTLMKMQKNDPLRLNIEHMLESADRAASLTQSLLTFSRKQITDRKPVDLNTILKKVEKFLVRVIGEDVTVHLALTEGEMTVLADVGQLEQVFMNLATNARDAMPKGGSFMVETSIIDMDSGFVTAHGYGNPGTYVMVSVTDTGVGMDEKTIKKIFEPFFTTKEVGKGTGLGLAMVYGILKQNEGFINVYSEPGKGTTFRIYFPLIKASALEGQKAVKDAYPKGGTETILLAEDDASLRKLSVVVLEQMGYTVITASDGEEAVTKFMENKDRIQLLLFDIIMPKKNGREAYEEIRKVAPTIPVLFASGYSPDMLREKALIEKDEAMIAKPMSPQALLKKLREVLDRKK